MVSFTVFKGSENGQIKESTTTREVGPDEVLLKVTHSGVCGTDEHYRRTDMVLGHEGVGIVEVSLLPIRIFPRRLSNFSDPTSNTISSKLVPKSNHLPREIP